MLVLSRKKGESIIIDDQIEVTILSIDGDTIKLGIAAPKNIDIHRKEIYEAIQLSNQSAAVGSEFLKDWLNEKSTEQK
ncbi:carbon storage regulator [Paenibacillus sp. SORGH_AS306]|uniref:Translational regulator CsrA n=1 Tax=Paenibacillus kyungheensis TaxID=1452732 RepID=A0AAX3LZE5_9BACL|nr:MULTISPECIES: carbon storage regulator CsrA [Paenibacillus]MDQ1235885.1 carbon storage regulator [Paenibacillus sp. SORGH_AS_0306]MDR6112935.1 carbon storage regulator [Paenibacillus sp. SORGH_AS_0338]WCT55374.1 carbon storage regulator CsrA [Paenibacillus kyungheensis]